MKTLQERFADKVIPDPNSECWLWTAAVDRQGYGMLRSGNGMCRAHRVSYELHIGQIPKGLLVCHTCDVPGCVNPDHLWLGTNATNMVDMTAKGRRALGVSHGKAKLTEDQVRAIRADLRALRLIAKDYDIGFRQIGRIRKRQQWASLA